MVIRKPYAFLIRHFRLIHFLIIIPMFITLLCTRTVLDFFSTFVASGYVTSETNIAYNYINPLVYVSLILVISSVVAIIFLLRTKDKDIKAHLIITIFYSILLVGFFILPGILSNFETTDVAPTTSRMIRDIVSFLYYIQYIFILLTFIKGLGFDFERFQFIDLLSELDIDEEDSDEVEFRIGVEGYKAKRKARFLLREFKAYLLENKFFVSIILGVILIILIILLIINIVTGNQNIRINQRFSLQGFSVKFNNAIVSNLDYNGHLISKDDYFLAVNIYVKNISGQSKELDTSAFYLDVGEKDYIYPTLSYGSNFVDFGRPYYNGKIFKDSECEYLIVYKLSRKQVRTSYTIKILDSVIYKEDEIIPKYKIINLKPQIIDEIRSENKVNLGDEVNFKNTNLLDTKVRIDSYTLTNRYVYEYNFCLTEGDCRLSRNSVTPDTPSSKGQYTLLALNGEFDIDKESSYSKYKLNTNDFFKDFMEIEYTVGGVTHTSKVTNKTPEEVDGTVIIQVPMRVENAEAINLILTVRDKRFIYKIK